MCITSYKGAKAVLFNATIQQKTEPGQEHSIVDGYSTHALQTLQSMALSSHYQLQFNIPPICASLSHYQQQFNTPPKWGGGGGTVEGLGIDSSILLQASSSASSCLAKYLPPKHPIQYVVKYIPWLQQRKTHSRGEKLREKKIFSPAT